MAERTVNERRQIRMGRVVVYAVLSIAAVVIANRATVLGGFKTLGELRVNPIGWPQDWVWSNYWEYSAAVVIGKCC